MKHARLLHADLAHGLDHILQSVPAEVHASLLKAIHDDVSRVHRAVTAELPEPNLQNLQQQSHILIGLAGTLGAMSVHAAARGMYDSTLAENSDGALRYWRLIAPQLDELLEILLQRIAGMGDND